MIRFSCACGRELQGREEDAGKQASCPACGAVSVIPQPEGIARQEDLPGEQRERARSDAVRPDRSDSRREREDEEDRPRRRPRVDAPEATSGKATAALVLGLISFPCIVGNFLTGIPAIILGALALKDISKSDGRLGGKGLAIGGLITGSLGLVMVVPALLIALLLPAVQKVREAAARAQDANNLKQIGLAMHNYHSSFGAFPEAAAFRSPDGKPLLSWRVAILPYIEQDNLYKQFKLDEPWDSPHNQQFLSMMPRVYMQPGQPPDGSGVTHYQVFVGPKSMFEERPFQKGIGQPPIDIPGLGFQRLGFRLTDVPDGTANTILVATGANPVPWTKPEDLPFDPLGPLPPLGGQLGSGFNVAFVDGSVRLIPKNTPEAVIKPAITRNGGEPITLP
jgi:prepilin-type processing-associated H-X9-DG protein